MTAFFLRGDPGYKLYEDIAFTAVAALCWCAVVFFIIQLRRDPNDLGRVALTVSFILKGITYALAPPSVGAAVAEWMDTPNLTRLVSNIATGIMCCSAIVIALSCWNDPPEQRKRTAAVWLSLTFVVIVAMVGLWFHAPLPQTTVALSAHVGTNAEVAATLIIYDVSLIFGLVKIRSLCARYAACSQENWVTRGLKLVGWGTAISLGYACVFLAGVCAPFVGTDIPYWHAVTVPTTAVSFSLILIGFTLPSFGPRVATVRRHVADARTHRKLKPLWEDLVRDSPGIVLHEPSPHPRDAGYRLYRRVIEVRDGLTRLAEFITSDELAPDSLDPARTAARQIRQALDDKRVNGGADWPVGFAPLVGDNPTLNFEEEIQWLCRIAAHYAQLDTTPHQSAARTHAMDRKNR